MATAKRPSASRATRRTPATSDGAPKAAAPADPSFSFHWRISYRTVDAGWHTQRQMTDAIIDALATTQVWHHLPRLGGGADHTKPRGTPAATKKVIASGASRFVFTSDAPDIDMWGEGATAYLELEYGRRALHVTCALKQPLIGELGAKTLDDLFTFARAYYDLIERKAYVTAGKAWTTWDRNDPLPKRQATWELRALADVLEPSRPADDERDDVDRRPGHRQGQVAGGEPREPRGPAHAAVDRRSERSRRGQPRDQRAPEMAPRHPQDHAVLRHATQDAEIIREYRLTETDSAPPTPRNQDAIFDRATSPIAQPSRPPAPAASGGSPR
ncbi:MAG: hypothetical protein JNK64_03850 [Myxococcales bacterium]|nr:hypothetical protein [Myxococcales bacterium]